MADFNVSVTMSNEPAPTDLSAGSVNNFIISNPNAGSSYFVLETLANSNGAYDSNSPKNLQGTLSGDSGITGIVSDDYKAGVVVSPEGGTLTFTPTNTISKETLRFRGTGAGYELTSSLPSFVGLLDEYPGVAGGYSLRKLRTEYTGSAIEVTRVLDSTTTNIGFDSNGDLDTSTLTSFCSGFNCAVTTWYDQGTSGSNATTPSLDESPVIYTTSSGLITVNGKPAMLFEDQVEFFQMPISASSRQDFFVVLKTNDTKFILMKGDTTGKYNFAVNQNQTTNTSLFANYGSPTYYKNGDLQTPTYRSDMYDIFSSTNTQLLITNLAGNSSIWGNQFNFGFYTSTNSLQGYVQEAIYYNSDQSSNQSNIESNIMSYYNIS